MDMAVSLCPNLDCAYFSIVAFSPFVCLFENAHGHRPSMRRMIAEAYLLFLLVGRNNDRWSTLHILSSLAAEAATAAVQKALL